LPTNKQPLEHYRRIRRRLIVFARGDPWPRIAAIFPQPP